MGIADEFLRKEKEEQERKAEEAVEASLINMNKYFQIYEYGEYLKAILEIYQLQGKATLWWEEMKALQKIEEQEVTFMDF